LDSSIIFKNFIAANTLFLHEQPLPVIRFYCLLIFLICAIAAGAQTAGSGSLPAAVDSLVIKDSLGLVNLPEAVSLVNKVPSFPFINFQGESLSRQLQQEMYKSNAFILFDKNAETGNTEKPFLQKREGSGKEYLFYLMIGVLLLFAAFRQVFPKYFSDLMRIFFRNTLKAKQIRDQLTQTPLPSLLLNFFFALTMGLYITLVLRHYNLTPFRSFWLLFLYCSLGLIFIYAVKYAGLRFFGWLFSMQEVADSFSFIVFIINKAIGIFIIPFLILIAFTQNNVLQAAITLSWCCVGVLLLYRFILSYSIVRGRLSVNPFHFFLYLCAFELAPLLILYKALLLAINA
jgi:hypothetical protein